MLNEGSTQYLGKGIMLTANLRRSELSWPGKRRQVVTPDMVAETRWFRSPKVGVVSLSVRKQMSYSASLSMQYVSSVFSTSWCTDSVQLYGSTTTSDTCNRVILVTLLSNVAATQRGASVLVRAVGAVTLLTGSRSRL